MTKEIIVDDPHVVSVEGEVVFTSDEAVAKVRAGEKALAEEMAAARAAHLSPAEQRIAEFRLGVPRGTYDGPPVGLIVGEAPGPNTHARLPMFPFPPTSAGGRLMAMSGLPPNVYLGRFFRRNLFETYVDATPWVAKVARERALELARWIEETGSLRVVVCGVRVAEAFGMTLWGRSQSADGRSAFVSIPHPSGLTRVYNDPRAREAARTALQWAAGLGELRT